MAELKQIIMDEIESYGVKATAIGIDVTTKGVFKKKKFLHVFGVVNSDEAKETVNKVVNKHSGDSYEVVDELKVDKNLV